MRRLTRSAMALVSAAALSACGSVPDITFGELDASRDAAAETSRDGDTRDIGVAPDGQSSCPGVIPAGATGCCETLPCVGDCNVGDCQKCAAACTGEGLVCCAARRPITCVAAGTPCP